MNVLTPIVPYHFHDQAGFGKPVIKKKKKKKELITLKFLRRVSLIQYLQEFEVVKLQGSYNGSQNI